MDAVPTELLEPNDAGIARAGTLLRAGRLVAFGTETVYGLGADATDPDAVARIYAAKQRPANNPLIVHVADADAAFTQGLANPAAHRLAGAFWPGPLTLVLPRHPYATVCDAVGAGRPSLALRVPDHALALALLRSARRPVAAPSANRSGAVSPSTAAHVLDGLGGRIDAVLECGPCRVGVESTILDLRSDQVRLLRPGGIPREAIEALIGPVDSGKDDDTTVAMVAPGQFASHYAPSLALRLDAADAAPDEALLAFGQPVGHAALVWRLSDRGDIEEAAARLFAGLRALDQEGLRRGLSRIAVMPIPATGLGAAIRDRLARAAAPRTLAAAS